VSPTLSTNRAESLLRALRPLGLAAGILVTLATSAVHADDSSSGWEILRVENGIQVARKAVPGSSFVAFRGEGDVPAPLLSVANVLVDVSHNNQWMDSIREARILRKVSDTDYVLYCHIGTPPLVTDRDFVYTVHLTIEGGGTGFRVDMRSTDDPSAPKTDYVRGNLTGSTFTLQASPDRRSTHVVAEIHADPMGNIPGWLMNAFQKSWGYNTIVGLRRQVAAGRSPQNPLLVGRLANGVAP
jgi:hypothetical protein